MVGSGIFVGVGLIVSGVALLVFTARLLARLNGILAPSVKSASLDRNVTFLIRLFSGAWILFGALILVGTIGVLAGV